MKKLILIITSLTLGGCMPSQMGQFYPYTTSTGQSGWRFDSKELTPDLKSNMIEAGIATHKICPNGWRIVGEKQIESGVTRTEGLCK